MLKKSFIVKKKKIRSDTVYGQAISKIKKKQEFLWDNLKRNYIIVEELNKLRLKKDSGEASKWWQCNIHHICTFTPKFI